MQRAKDLSKKIGLKAACAALGVPRSSLYRAEKPRPSSPRTSPRALSAEEKAQVRERLNGARFQDQAPREVYATLLDEGKYFCSWRSMYRILDENREVCERRDQLRHPNYTEPELLATAPNQLWSWDTPALAPQVQVLPNCSDRPNGRTFTYTSSWMCIAATSWGG